MRTVGGDEPEWIEAEKKFTETLQKHNKPRGGFGFGPAVKQKADQGYSCKSSIFLPCLILFV